MIWDFDDIVNRKLRSVKLSADKERITFHFQEGPPRAYGVEGDCCSRSWIEHLEMPPDVDGATLLGVEENSEDKTDDEKLNPPDADCGGREHESLQVYQTMFHTDRGDITLEYRNSSNGYYGGYLVDAAAEERP